MFENEILPENGRIRLTDEPGWGLRINRKELNLKRVQH